jgi:hypothetical protein
MASSIARALVLVFAIGALVACSGSARTPDATDGARDAVVDAQSTIADSADATSDATTPPDASSGDVTAPTDASCGTPSYRGPPFGTFGSPCVTSADCTSGHCVGGACSRVCATAMDCPPAPQWSCLLESTMSGMTVCSCRPTGVETCNGQDDDCNGLIDDRAVCADGASCVAGSCVCDAASTCSGACTDTASDTVNCGACGVACSGEQGCVSGSCGAIHVEEMVMSSGVACARFVDGTVRCWGQVGLLGDGVVDVHYRLRTRPAPVPGLTGIERIAASEHFICAMHADGVPNCWNFLRWHSGVGLDVPTGDLCTVPCMCGLGFEYVACARTPAASCSLQRVVGIAMLGDIDCALTSDGILHCAITGGPLMPLGSLPPMHQIAAAVYHACALDVAGGVWCWGDNTNGALGDGTTTNSATPIGVLGIRGALQVAVGTYHSCALRGDGTVACWGLNWDAQLGQGDAGVLGGVRQSVIPLAVPGLTGVVEIASGDLYTCARRMDGTVRCWGNDPAIGLAGTEFTTPTVVAGLPPVDRIWAGGMQVCARGVDGTVFCWGQNTTGLLADGTTTSRDVPAPIRW